MSRPRFFSHWLCKWSIQWRPGLIPPSPRQVTVPPWHGRPPCVYKILWSLVPGTALYFWSAFLCWFYNMLVLREALLTWGSAWIPNLSVTLESCFCLIISEEWAPSFRIDQNLLVSLAGKSYKQRHLAAAMTMGCPVKRVPYTLPSKPGHFGDWKRSLFTRMPGPRCKPGLPQGAWQPCQHTAQDSAGYTPSTVIVQRSKGQERF